MDQTDRIRKLLHDLSTPLAVLMLIEDELPDHANAAVQKLYQIIESCRLELQKQSSQ